MPWRGQLRTQEPANPLDPEIQREMITQELHVPKEFKGYVEEGEIADLDKRDRKTILAMSIQSQWIDWLIEAVVQQNTMIQQLDAENARRKIEADKKKPERILWMTLRWIGLAVGVGLLSELGKSILKLF